jgi:DHA2 family lincomycin resistance protein-like MFS transporter
MPTDSKPRLPKGVGRIVFILLGANFVAFLNETVLGVALPKLMRDLNISASTGQWLTTAFLLTMAAVIPVTGYLQSRHSTRNLFMLAMITFIVGTTIAALSGSFVMLLIGRVLQAAGTALLMPMFMTTLMKIVPENMRGALMGQVSLVFAVAPALGPAASGLIVQAWGWHALFWVVLPIAIAALVVGSRWLHLEHEPGPARLDLPSLVLTVLGFSTLIYGLSEVGTAVRGEAAFNPVFAILPGAALVVWFVLRQLKLGKTNSALLDLATFRSRAFRNALTLMSVLLFSLYGVIIVVPIYTQNVLHQTALATGLMMMPGGLLQGLVGGFAGKLYDKVGAPRILIPALSAFTLGIFLMTFFDQNTPMWQVFIAFSIISGALGFAFPVMFSVSMSSLGAELYSHGSATIGVSQQVSGAAGTAGFVAVLTMLSGVTTATSSPEQLNAGTHGAFLAGAVFAVVALVISLRVRPDAQPASPEVPAQVESASAELTSVTAE